jgi:hypothetical protein
VERLPLLQLHWEDFRYPGYLEVAQRLVELQKGGLIQHFGVANFDVPHLVRLAEAGITPVTNQVRRLPVCEGRRGLGCREGESMTAVVKHAADVLCRRKGFNVWATSGTTVWTGWYVCITRVSAA